MSHVLPSNSVYAIMLLDIAGAKQSDRVTLESYGVIRSIPMRIRGSEYRLDFHIYDISDMSLLIGVPLGTLFRERSKQVNLLTVVK